MVKVPVQDLSESVADQYVLIVCKLLFLHYQQADGSFGHTTCPRLESKTLCLDAWCCTDWQAGGFLVGFSYCIKQVRMFLLDTCLSGELYYMAVKQYSWTTLYMGYVLGVLLTVKIYGGFFSQSFPSFLIFFHLYDIATMRFSAVWGTNEGHLLKFQTQQI